MNKTNIIECLSNVAERTPDKLALSFLSDGDNLDAQFTYGTLATEVGALAAELLKYAQPGDRALLLYPSGAEYVTAYLACLWCGVIAVPAYPPQSLQPAHLSRVVAIARDASPKLVLSKAALLSPLRGQLQLLPELAHTTLLATDEQVWMGPSAPLVAGGERVAMLQYTSGSTSTPKGVMLSHDNLSANERVIQSAFAMTPEDIVVSWLPLFHDMGLIGTLLQPLFSGISAVLMPHQRFMERPRRWLEALSHFGGTVSGAPDFAYRLCAERVDPSEGVPLDLSRWRLAFCGAEPIRISTLRAFEKRFAGVGFAPSALYPCYGLAEASLLVAGGESGSGVHAAEFDAAAIARGTAASASGGSTLIGHGGAWLEHGVKIAEPETSRFLPDGSVGEILASGASIALGYWNNPQATEQAFVVIDGVRYLRTGDLGFIVEGSLFVTGRRKDMIIVRGQNLYPQDLELMVEEQVSVVRKGRVVAFGIEHAGKEGIGIVAEVSPRLRKLIEPEEVCRAVAEAVGQGQGEKPALVALAEAGTIPITSSGKLQRSATRSLWFRRADGFIFSWGAAAPTPSATPNAH